MKSNLIEQIGKYCFCLAMAIEVLVVLIDKSAYINPYESMLFRITFVLFGVKILTTKFNKKEWICVFAAGILSVIPYFVNERDEMIRAVVLIVACKDIDLRKELKYVLYLTFAGCAVIVFLAATGIYGIMSVTADYGRDGMETRYVLGMGHPNAFHCMLWCVILLGIYLYHEHFKWYHYVFLMVWNLLAYYLTASNTGMLIITMTILGTALLQYVKPLKNQKAIYWLAALLLLSCVVFSIVGAYMGNGWDRPDTFMYKLDKIINGRYQSAFRVEAAHLENWTLFGNYANQEYFDAAFIRVFYWYGIFGGIGYVLFNLYLIYLSWKNKDAVLLMIIALIAVYSLIEAHFISVYLLRNYLLLFMGAYWYQPLETENSKKCYLWGK